MNSPINFIKNIFKSKDASGESADHRKTLGAIGEKLAADHYKRLGFIVIEMNYSCKLGEVDIIAKKGNLIVFSEVKTRKSDKYGPPELAVNKKKQERIKRLAKHYAKIKKLDKFQIRFDVISIIIPDAGNPAMKHIEAAF